MIEINLLPPAMRRKTRKRVLAGGFHFPLEVVIGLGGGLLMLLILVHVVLLGVNILKMAKYKDLQSQMDLIEDEKNEVDGILQKVRSIKNKKKDLSKIILDSQILWSQKLNLVSDDLPRDVWLKRVAFSDDVMFVQGSAISRQNNEMVSVHLFTAKMKDTPVLQDDFENFELGPIKRRSIGKIEVVDFMLTAPLKGDSP